jgi:hypothetical protein
MGVGCPAMGVGSGFGAAGPQSGVRASRCLRRAQGGPFSCEWGGGKAGCMEWLRVRQEWGEEGAGIYAMLRCAALRCAALETAWLVPSPPPAPLHPPAVAGERGPEVIGVGRAHRDDVGQHVLRVEGRDVSL